MKPTVTYNMRDMVNWTLDELRAHPQVPIIVVCDDGEIEGIIEEFTISWFLWEFHRRYPKTPHLLSHHFSGRLLTPKTHLDILGAIQKDCFMATAEHKYSALQPYNALVYQCFNELYNFMAGQLNQYMTSISILDYLEVMEHPEIKALNAEFKGREYIAPIDIKEIGDKITHILDNEPGFKNNALQRAFKHRLVRINAILQDISPRGFVTDVDSVLFPKPIRTGYVEGIRELADYAAETRTASQAAMMQKAPMEDAEHLNRLLQLSVSRIAHIDRHDCGSTAYTEWYVEDKSKLNDLDGMYYLDPDRGEVRAIEPAQDQHLVGDVINLRTVFGCQHPDRDTICAVCFGDLTINVFPTDNIGQISAIEFQSNQSQKLLSYKHYTASSSFTGVYMGDTAREYFEFSPDVKYITFKAGLDTSRAQLIIPRESFRGFEAIQRITNWKTISASRLSKIVDLIFIPDREDMSNVWATTVADLDNPVNLTLDALKFLSKTTFEINSQNEYIFDMSGWDASIPLLSIPRVQFDVVRYLKYIERFVIGPKNTKEEKLESITSYKNPVKALKRLHDLVTTGGPDKKNPGSMALSHLQVVVLAMSCEDPDNGDYRPPLNRMEGVFPGLRAIMHNNSPAVALAYQTQQQDVFSPTSYIGRPRPDHALDYLLFGDTE